MQLGFATDSVVFLTANREPLIPFSMCLTPSARFPRARGPHAPCQLSGFPLPPGWDASAHAFPPASCLRTKHLFLLMLVLLGLLESK
jgi:hypothetical protein